jgi:hypothetical protein
MTSDGTQLGTADGRLQDGRVIFRYAGTVDGRAVAEYRVSVRN